MDTQEEIKEDLKDSNLKEERRRVIDRRGNVDSRVVVAVKNFLFAHSKVILGTIIVVCGSWYALGNQVKLNTETGNRNIEDIAKLEVRAMNTEKMDIELHAADQLVLQRLDTISGDIKDLKSTLTLLDSKMNDRMNKMNEKNELQYNEIRKLLYKPVVGNNASSTHFDIIEMSAGDIARK